LDLDKEVPNVNERRFSHYAGLLAVDGQSVDSMIKASQFGLFSVQTVIYTPDEARFSPPRILASILSAYVDRFDGPVTTIPLPDDAPSSLPRVMLQSRDGMWKLNASPSRIDSVWVASVTQPSGAGAVVRCSEVLEAYVRSSGIRVGRLALVVVRACETSDAAQLLIERFCNERSQAAPFNRSANFEIHNHKRYRLQSVGRDINSWVRCRSGLLQQKPAVAVEQDLNTLEEELHQNTFDADAIRNHFDHAQAEAEAILRLYFPEEQ